MTLSRSLPMVSPVRHPPRYSVGIDNAAAPAPAATRRKWYFVLGNLGFALAVIAGALAGLETPATYLILLFLICSFPLMLGEAAHGRYVILLIFMPLYFVLFGLYDLMALFPGLGLAKMMRPPDAILTEAEGVILAGAALLVCGYATVSGLLKRRPPLQERDWNLPIMLVVGLTCWVLGVIGTWIWQLERADAYVSQNFSLGTLTLLVFLNMLSQLGALLLIYAAVARKGKLPALLLLVALAVGFVVGFLGDSKELAMRTLLMLLAAQFLINGRVSKIWLISGVVIILATYSVFQSYRDILHVRAQSRQKALDNISANLDAALSGSASGTGRVENSVRAMVERLDLKAMINVIVERTGTTVPYQQGSTLAIVLYSFIPRAILPDKPDTSIGLVFNKAFRLSESAGTYISSSQLGELYWNYGWPGVIIGMLIIGAILGAVGTRFNLVERRSVTRLLIILTTIYLLCLRFESGFGMQYTLWLRYLAIIWLLHLLFRNRATASITAPRTLAAASRRQAVKTGSK